MNQAVLLDYLRGLGLMVLLAAAGGASGLAVGAAVALLAGAVVLPVVVTLPSLARPVLPWVGALAGLAVGVAIVQCGLPRPLPFYVLATMPLDWIVQAALVGCLGARQATEWLANSVDTTNREGMQRLQPTAPGRQNAVRFGWGQLWLAAYAAARVGLNLSVAFLFVGAGAVVVTTGDGGLLLSRLAIPVAAAAVSTVVCGVVATAAAGAAVGLLVGLVARLWPGTRVWSGRHPTILRLVGAATGLAVAWWPLVTIGLTAVNAYTLHRAMVTVVGIIVLAGWTAGRCMSSVAHVEAGAAEA